MAVTIYLRKRTEVDLVKIKSKDFHGIRYLHVYIIALFYSLQSLKL